MHEIEMERTMKILVVYTSQTGFTKRYAIWLANRLKADVLELDEAKKKQDHYFDAYEAIIYGGWAMAGSVVKSKWFFDRAVNWKEKRLAIFCVGASPMDNPEVEEALKNMVPQEQKEYIKGFYCQGGLDYDKMNFASKMAMKAFVAALRKKKNPTDMERDMVQWMDHSYDISDEKYIEPIVEYVEK